MPMRKRKRPFVQEEGEEGNARLKPPNKEDGLNPWTSPGGSFKIDCDLPEPFTNHTQYISQTNAIQRSERSIDFSRHGVTMEVSVVDPL